MCTGGAAGFGRASQADKGFAERMDVIGSVGATATLFDESEAFAKEGVRTVVINTGEFKTAGELGTEITARQEADFQRIVDGFFDDFVATVARGRGMGVAAVKESADGRMFFAPAAVKRGLIDGVQTLDVTIAGLLATDRPNLAAAKRVDRRAF